MSDDEAQCPECKRRKELGEAWLDVGADGERYLDPARFVPSATWVVEMAARSALGLVEDNTQIHVLGSDLDELDNMLREWAREALQRGFQARKTTEQQEQQGEDSGRNSN